VRAPKRQDGRITGVEVVPELCMNFRNCVRIAPGAFITDPQTGKTRAALWERATPDQLWAAGWSCPSGAIRVLTDDGYVVPRWDEIAHWESDRHRAAALERPKPPADNW
jgi:ferredoxin